MAIIFAGKRDTCARGRDWLLSEVSRGKPLASSSDGSSSRLFLPALGSSERVHSKSETSCKHEREVVVMSLSAVFLDSHLTA